LATLQFETAFYIVYAVKIIAGAGLLVYAASSGYRDPFSLVAVYTAGLIIPLAGHLLVFGQQYTVGVFITDIVHTLVGSGAVIAALITDRAHIISVLVCYFVAVFAVLAGYNFLFGLVRAMLGGA
jgi:hypothetical protein